MVQPQLVKIGGPWTRSMIRGSMDPVHERGSVDPVHILMDPVHGPGPRRGSMDQGSMFCTFPLVEVKKLSKVWTYFRGSDIFWKKSPQRASRRHARVSMANALLSRFLSDCVAMFTQAVGMTASDWSVSDVVKTRQNNHPNLASLIFHKNCC